MNIKKQIQLIRRIRADLCKEAYRHRDDGNRMAAADCDEQANGLDDVLTTLRGISRMAEAVSVLKEIIEDPPCLPEK